MPGCAAVGCHNRSEKGFIMKCFPRDPTLRKLWQGRVARADWEPSNNSFLCHVHFKAQEWLLTENGRIRLKKNAIPSIFNVTSTRKSPKKKRIKSTSVKMETECENDCTIGDYLENDTEHSSVGDHAEEKDSDSRDIDGPSVGSLVHRSPVNRSAGTMEDNRGDSSVGPCGEDAATSDPGRESVVLISDDNNTETGSNANERDLGGLTNTRNGRSTSNCTATASSTGMPDVRHLDNVVKTEVKREADRDSTFYESYDEIEEKLKRICDGYREETSACNGDTVQPGSVPAKRSRSSKRSETRVPSHRSINYRYSPRNEIGDMLADDAGNIEIIFGSESGQEEYAHAPGRTCHGSGAAGETHSASKSTRRNPSIDRATTIDDNREVEKNHVADTGKALGGERNVKPNIRAAMKRKRRTREEIMKSIKRSIRGVPSRATKPVSNSSDTLDTAVHTNVVAQMHNDAARSKCNPSKTAADNVEPTTRRRNEETDTVGSAVTRFTVRVTGDRDDVVDIMQDLFQGTKDFVVEEREEAADTQRGDDAPIGSVTSVITIDDSDSPRHATGHVASNRDALSTSVDSSIASYHAAGDDDDDNDDSNDECATLPSAATHSADNCAIEYECRKLREKGKTQQDVIRKLTEQLVSYKDLERDLQSKSSLLETKTREMENMMCEFNGRSADGSTLASSASYKRNTGDPRQRLAKDLSSRISYFEEMNKKLMKTVTVECQQKRKLEGQIKQRDNRIKELNWKLEKASKFLERAEKNTNTYRRKMLNMQTFMRRKKLLDERMSRFNEMLMDVSGAKEDYSEKALAMAMEMREICGMDGYDRLLSFGFPLPALSALRGCASDAREHSDSNESNDRIARALAFKGDANEQRDTECLVTSEHSRVTESTRGPRDIALDSTETVTGTVQDIFDESNDADDFSTNELREHFILQLNAVM